MAGQTTQAATQEVDQASGRRSPIVGELVGGQGFGEHNATRGRNGGGRFTTTLKGQHRDIEAARLQSMGWSLSKIMAHLGYSSTGHVVNGITRAYQRVPSQAVEVRRQQQQQLLDHLKGEALGVLARPHVAHSNGKVVREGCPGKDYAGQLQHEGCTWGVAGQYCDGPAVLDDGPKLQAISTIKALLDREAKLHGLDSPIRVEQTDVGVVIVLEGISMDDL